MNVPRPPSRTAGLVVFALLSVGDVASLAALAEPDGPPAGVLGAAALLGLASLALVALGWRDPSRPLRLLVGLRTVSALLAVPGLLVPDVAVGLRVAAGTVVVLTVVGVLLVARGRTAPAVAA